MASTKFRAVNLADREALLQDLDRNAQYWENQSALERAPSRSAMCLKKRNQCLQLAAKIRTS